MERSTMRRLCLVILSFVFLSGLAVAEKPDIGQVIIRDMPKDKIAEKIGTGVGLKLRPEELAKMASYRFTGDTLRLLAVLVEWSDRPGTYSSATLDSLLFVENEFPGGSVADYFKEVSYGQMVVTGDVVGWINAGSYNPYFDFATLFDVLDPMVDFSQYDGDQDGNVDAVCFIRSGNGEEDSQDPNDIWSYAMISYVGWGPYDGVRIMQWNTSPETRPLRDELNPTQFSGVDTLNRIRVFCHELSHNLGLPDLYDYDNKLDEATYYTPNDANDHPLYDWCLMGYYGYGYFSLGADVPSHLSGWCRTQLEWLEPITLADDFEGVVRIRNVATDIDSSLFLLPVDMNDGEYFLLEYRNPRSLATFDKLDSDFSCYFWPDLTYGCDTLDRGLLITHIHDSLVPPEEWYGMNNGTPVYTHYSVVVVDAGYDPARPEWYNPEGHVTDSAQWWYPYETRKGALFSNDVDGQNVFGPSTVPNSDGYGGPSGIYVEILSMDDDALYAFVDMNVEEVPCCQVRGDFNHDGVLLPNDVSDGIPTNPSFIGWLYLGGAGPPCLEEADVNGDGEVNPMDLLYIVDYFWRFGPAPVPCP